MTVDQVYVYVYICVWVVCASALSFYVAKYWCSIRAIHYNYWIQWLWVNGLSLPQNWAVLTCMHSFFPKILLQIYRLKISQDLCIRTTMSRRRASQEAFCFQPPNRPVKPLHCEVLRKTRMRERTSAHTNTNYTTLQVRERDPSACHVPR